MVYHEPGSVVKGFVGGMAELNGGAGRGGLLRALPPLDLDQLAGANALASAAEPSAASRPRESCGPAGNLVQG